MQPFNSRVAKLAHEQLVDLGYSLVSGAAILNDVVSVELSNPYPQMRTMTLKAPESVACFNLECGNDWRIYRKESA